MAAFYNDCCILIDECYGRVLLAINFSPLNAFAKGVLFAVPGTHLEQLVDGNFLITEHYEQPGQSP